MEHGLGLIYDPVLEAAHKAELNAMVRTAESVHSSEMPERIDLRDIIPVNDQGPYGSCDGNSVDFCCQVDHWLSTKVVVNTSARFAYLAARMKDAQIEGRQLTNEDGGASISGGILAARDYGAVLEADFPYWRFDWNSNTAEPFDIRIPDEVMQKAQKHRVQSVTPVLWHWTDMLPLVATGQASFSIGMYWSLGDYRGGAPITKYRPAGDGHALAVCEYEMVDGERWPRVRNSHGRGWGDKGTMVVRPDVFDYMLRSAPWGARGMSGLPAFTKRKIDTYKGSIG